MRDATGDCFLRHWRPIIMGPSMRLLCTNDDGILAHGLECLVAAARAARRGHRGRARPRAERDEPLAHAASSAAAGEARRAALAGRRHADRLRDARRRGADARAARLRAQRHQPRPEHGRGRAVLAAPSPRRWKDSRSAFRRSRSRSPAATCAPTCRCSSEQVRVLTPLLAHLTSLPSFPANTLLNVNLPPLPADEMKGVRLTRLGRRVYSRFAHSR